MRNAADSRGVFKAKIQKTPWKDGDSTFFPAHYRPEDIVRAGQEAAVDLRRKPGLAEGNPLSHGNVYYGKDSTGMILEIHKSSNGRVEDFFPVHELEYNKSRIAETGLLD